MAMAPTVPVRSAPGIVEVISVLDGRVKTLASQAPSTPGIVNDDGSVIKWEEASAVNNGTIRVYVQDNAPTGLNASTDVGSQWYDSDAGNAKSFWDGFVWLSYNTALAFFQGSTTLSAMGPALLYRSLTSLRIYSQGTAPGSPAHGWMWRDTASGNAIKRWNGSAWITMTDTNLIAATNAALTGATLTDSFITVTYQASAPASPGAAGVGDLWFETDNNWKQYRFDGSGWAIDGESVAPAASDGVPPPYSPTPTLITGIGSLFISWPAVPNADTVGYNVYVSSNSSVPTTGTEFAGTAFGTFMQLRKLPGGADFVAGTNYYAKVIAFDVDGPAAASAASAAGTVSPTIIETQITDDAITTPKLATNSVTTDALAANSVYAGAIQSGAITTSKLSATAIDGMTITAVTISAATITGTDITGSVLSTYGYLGNTTTYSVLTADDVVCQSGTQNVSIASVAYNGGPLNLYPGLTMTRDGVTFGKVVFDGTEVAVISNFLVTGTSLFQGNVSMDGHDIVNVDEIQAVGGSSGLITMTGVVRATKFNATAPPTLSTVPNARWTSSGGGDLNYTSHSNSSLRYKKDIDTLALSDEQMYGWRGVSYKLKKKASDRPADHVFWGVIAEELHDLGFGTLLEFDDEGRPDEVDYAKLGVTVQQVAIRDLHKRLLAAEAAIRELTGEE